MDARRPGRHDWRAGGALAHLLLVVVLALGVFVMHAVGHPEGSSGHDTTDTAPLSPAGAAPAHQSGAGPGHAPESGAPAPSHDSGMAMDMTTLCVAVLGVWLIAGLVRAALARRPDWPARLLPALGPNAPPPRAPDLAELSILRI
ncbi:DUF6153 family protein [Streptomyces sp. NPDC054861]